MEQIEMQTTDRNSLSRGQSAKPRFFITALVHRSSTRVNVWQPPTDYYEVEDEYVVRVEIAGMEHSEFRISYEDKVLVVQGRRTDSSETRAYRQMEIRFGEFLSYIELAGPVDVDGIEAEYHDGFLNVRLPKLKPSRVDIPSE